MTHIKRSQVIKALQSVEVDNKGCMNNFVNDAMDGKGEIVTSFLLRKGALKLNTLDLNNELDKMLANEDIKETEHQQMKGILNKNSNGSHRIGVFMKRQGRVKVVG